MMCEGWTPRNQIEKGYVPMRKYSINFNIRLGGVELQSVGYKANDERVHSFLSEFGQYIHTFYVRESFPTSSDTENQFVVHRYCQVGDNVSYSLEMEHKETYQNTTCKDLAIKLIQDYSAVKV